MIEDLVIYTPLFVPLFWAIVLFSSNQNRIKAKFILGIQMVAVFLLFLSLALFYKKVTVLLRFFEPVYIFSFLSLYPMFYWYIKLLTVETVYKLKNLVLFVPAVFFASAFIIIFLLMNPEEKKSFYLFSYLNNETGNSFEGLIKLQYLFFSFSKIVFIVQAFYFVILGHRLVKRYNQKIVEFYSNPEHKTINWVKFMLFSMIASLVITILYNILGREFFVEYPLLLFVPNLVLGVLIFMQGYLGNLQNYTVSDMEIETRQDSEIPLQKNVNSEKLRKSLLELFDYENIYINPDLKITHVSEKLFTNRTYISKLINTEFSCTFSDFVNQYRITEAKKLLADNSLKSYSLEYIAEKSGFGSMVNFMRVFREKEGITPGRYRERESLKINE